jgi:hypothetical protein
VAVEDAAADVDAADEAGPVRTEEAIIKEVTVTEVIAPPPTGLRREKLPPLRHLLAKLARENRARPWKR